MNSSISGHIVGWITAILAASGYFGLIGLMALESACVPVPSEVVLPFAGFLVAQGKMNLFVVATAGAIGCNLGSAIAYAVGRHGGRKAIDRWGRYFLITQIDLARADHFFERFGGLAVLIGRMLPVIRTFIALPAGIARMPHVRFHLYTFLGSWPWCFLLAYVGMRLGKAWHTSSELAPLFHYADYLIAGILLLVLARFVYGRIKAKRSE